MTIPRERSIAVVRTEQFLLALCDKHKTPRVPEHIREQARFLLRHYPTRLDMDTISM
ncbi:MAG: BPSL0761 family protein, partial [Fluviibacter sp.]